MGHGVKVTELFGIGTKYEISCTERQRLIVIVRDDGAREIYAFDKGDTEPRTMIQLDEEETRRVAAVLGGTFFGD